MAVVIQPHELQNASFHEIDVCSNIVILVLYIFLYKNLVFSSSSFK